MSKKEFEKRYNQLIDWNTATQTLNIIYNEITAKTDINDTMHNTFYGIG